jgi:polyhydroxybutyrate depolymerase
VGRGTVPAVRTGLPVLVLPALLVVGCSGSGSTGAPGEGGASPASFGEGGSSGDDASPAGGGSTGGTVGSGSSGGATGNPGGGAGGADSGGRETDADAGAIGTDGSSPGSVPARPSPGCGGSSAVTGNVDITYSGTARSYLLHMPASSPAGPLPLVVNLHPYTGTGAMQESITGMSALADSAGFVVAYPNGLGTPADWNAGSCCSAASEGNRDDVGFIDAVVDDVGAHACIDLARVYVTGFSNGGMMTVRLACQDADRFAAAATVSGTAAIPLDTCTPSRPIAFMHVHGTADPLVPYDGGLGGLPISGEPTPDFPAVSQEIATMRAEDQCPSASDVDFDAGSASCTHWGSCSQGAEVIFCTITGGTHAWPGDPGTGYLYTETSTFDATTEIWRFFQRHAIP